MRELSDQTKLSVRSEPIFFQVLTRLEADFGRGQGIKFRNRRLTKEGLVNLILAYVGSLPDREKWFVLAEGAAQAELLLSETDEERDAAVNRIKEIATMGKSRRVAAQDKSKNDLKQREEGKASAPGPEPEPEPEQKPAEKPGEAKVKKTRKRR